MKNYIRYGITTVCCWNIVLFLALIIRAKIKSVPISYFFDDGTNGIAITIFLVMWSLIWFGIGFYSRKDFLSKKQLYRNEFPKLEEHTFNKTFKSVYFSKHAKMLAIVFTTAIPWYIIGYVRIPLELQDFVIIILLTFLSIFFFGYYKAYFCGRKKY